MWEFVPFAEKPHSDKRTSRDLAVRSAIGCYSLKMTPADWETPESAAEALDAAEEALEREDYPFAFQLYLRGARAGNSDAQAMLAALYQTGIGVERSVIEAELWFLKAANQNNLVACNQLGVLYDSKHPELEDRWGDAQKYFNKAKELTAALQRPRTADDESDKAPKS